MTKVEYDSLNTFPVCMVTLTTYKSEKTNLMKGDSFMGVKKETLGTDDYSIIDSNGHPHYYQWCDLLFKN